MNAIICTSSSVLVLLCVIASCLNVSNTALRPSDEGLVEESTASVIFAFTTSIRTKFILWLRGVFKKVDLSHINMERKDCVGGTTGGIC